MKITKQMLIGLVRWAGLQNTPGKIITENSNGMLESAGGKETAGDGVSLDRQGRERGGHDPDLQMKVA